MTSNRSLGASSRLLLFLIAVCPTLDGSGSAQAAPIEVSAEGMKAIEVMSAFGKKIPVGGPYISVIAKLIFGEKSQPGYEEMKKAWEGYTNQQIEHLKLSQLSEGEDGYKRLLAQIKQIGVATAGSKRIVRGKWAHMETDFAKEVDSFKSTSAETARPRIIGYAALIHFHLDAFRQLITLTEERSERVAYLEDYNRYLSKYTIDLNAEIQKASRERAGDMKIVAEFASKRGKGAGKRYRQNIYDRGKLVYRGTRHHRRTFVPASTKNRLASIRTKVAAELSAVNHAALGLRRYRPAGALSRVFEDPYDSREAFVRDHDPFFVFYIKVGSGEVKVSDAWSVDGGSDRRKLRPGAIVYYRK